MKRGKDDQKPNVPIFPRLHVNDTVKGGPRAPPRNKMSLYERLSIPSHRFHTDGVSLNPNNTTISASQASVSQVNGLVGNDPFSLRQPPATSSPLANETNMTNTSTLLNLPEKVDNDDFTVPVFVQSQAGQLKDHTHKSLSREKLTSANKIYSGVSVEIQSASICIKKGRDAGSLHSNSQMDHRNQYELQREVSEPGSDQASKCSRSSSAREIFEGCRWEGDLSGSQEPQHPGSDVSMHNGDDWMHMKSNAGSQSDGDRDNNCLVDSARYIQNEGCHTSRCHIGSAEDPNNPINENNFQNDGNRIGKPFQLSNFDKCDVSTISMVDVVSDMSISPDDVVTILGQKYFLKARRAIAKQQRVFAVQVFELHRLIKVQQLIAGSPEDPLEAAVFLENSSPAKKICLEYVRKPQAESLECKDNSENPNHEIECSAENVIGKPSLSSIYSSGHLSSFSGNALQANMTADTKMSPWCFPQPVHQWLVPVMSPSEGLVYKPYHGPGISGSFPGGCVPYMNAVYGFPSAYPGFGVVPGTQPFIQSHFPPHGAATIDSAMSGAAVEQTNHVGGPCSFSQANQLSAGGSNSTAQQMPSAVLNQRDGTAPPASKLRVSKKINEVQGSTASSSCEILQGVAPNQIMDSGDAIPSFPVSPSAEPQTRVIKVVPHNRRSATKSAARIFQSIQKERKHFDIA